MFPIFAVPTLNDVDIQRPEFTLFIEGDSSNPLTITRTVVQSFARLVEDGEIKADGFEMFTLGADKRKVIIGSESLNPDEPVERDFDIPFACNRYMDMNGLYLEEKTAEFRSKANLVSPMAAFFNGYDFGSIPEFMEYTNKMRTVAAWRELLLEAQADIMGDYEAVMALRSQLPSITQENYKSVEVPEFTFNKVYEQFQKIFLDNFVFFTVQKRLKDILISYEESDVFHLAYHGIYYDGAFNQDLLNRACSHLKLMVRLVDSVDPLKDADFSQSNHDTARIHKEFLDLFTHSIDELDKKGIVEIFDGQVEVWINAFSLHIKPKGNLLERLKREYN